MSDQVDQLIPSAEAIGAAQVKPKAVEVRVALRRIVAEAAALLEELRLLSAAIDGVDLASARAPIPRGYLTIAEACAYLGISRPTLYAMGRRVRPTMKRISTGRAVRISVKELDRVAESLSKSMR
jgi:excisionase family DNA binding protein